MIVIFVGPMEQRFSFHQHKICSRSKWLEASCSAYRIEGQLPTNNLEHRLPDTNVGVFQEYWKWVYSGTLSFSRCTAESKVEAKIAEHTLLVKLYELGCSVKLEDVQLRNAVTLEMAKSLQACNMLPTLNLIAVVWSVKSHGDGLRNLFVDFMIARGICAHIGENLSQYPSTFAQELDLAALKKSPLVGQLATANNPRYLEPEEPEVKTT
jgi:hypothetical protein